MKKTLLVVGILCLLIASYFLDLQQILSLQSLKDHQAILGSWVKDHYQFATTGFFFLYVLLTALSLPGAAVLTLAAGAFFDFYTAMIIVSFASSLGALLAFLLSRYLFRDLVEKKASGIIQAINEGMKNEGLFYLLSLRLIPIFPFFLINIAMSLTKISAFSFYIVSQIGMLPGTAVYINAGTQLSQLQSLKDVMSREMFVAIFLLGTLPVFSAFVVGLLRRRRIYRDFKKPRSFQYNTIVIGGGSAGLIASYISALLKAKVALIERAQMGGDCLNTGCVPSKTLLSAAKVAHSLKSASDFGFTVPNYKMDFTKVMERIKKAIQKIAPNDSRERYQNLGVNCFAGEAKFLSPWEVSVDGKTLSARNIIIATGARPIIPDIKGLDRSKVLTSENLWNLDKLPSNFLIVGGGAIGCEMAQAFQRLGSQVTLVEKQNQLLAKEDPDVGSAILSHLKSEGIRVLLRTDVTSFEISEGAMHAVLSSGETEERLMYDQVLFAVGRKPDFSDLNISHLPFQFSSAGTIETDAFLRTSIPNIYIAGDALSRMQYTHAASHYAWYASINALFAPFKNFRLDESLVPRCVFTDPEIACVGQNENYLTSNNIAHRVFVYDLGHLDRVITDSVGGPCSLKIFLDPKSDRILGANIIAPRAAELLMEFVILMKFKKGLGALMSVTHPYPTYAESTKFLAGVFKKSTINHEVMDILRRYQDLRRNVG